MPPLPLGVRVYIEMGISGHNKEETGQQLGDWKNIAYSKTSY